MALTPTMIEALLSMPGITAESYERILRMTEGAMGNAPPTAPQQPAQQPAQQPVQQPPAPYTEKSAKRLEPALALGKELQAAASEPLFSKSTQKKMDRDYLVNRTNNLVKRGKEFYFRGVDATGEPALDLMLKKYSGHGDRGSVRWTDDELNDATSLFEVGYNRPIVAAALRRSVPSINTRFYLGEINPKGYAKDPTRVETGKRARAAALAKLASQKQATQPDPAMNGAAPKTPEPEQKRPVAVRRFDERGRPITTMADQVAAWAQKHSKSA